MSDSRELVEPLRTFGKSPPKDSVQKVKPLPERVDVGTQVVGSHHMFHVADLVSNGYHTVAIATRGAPEFQRDPATAGRELAPYDAPLELKVMFAPSRVGTFDAVLDVIIDRHLDVHNDGGSETRQIKLHGAAKDIYSLPPASERPSGTQVANPSPVTREQIAPVENGLDDVQRYFNLAHTGATGLAVAQRDGVANVEKSAEHFKPAPTTGPIWSILADAALSMGLGGIAGAVGKTLAKKLGTSLSIAKDGPSETLVNSLTDVVKDGIKTSGKGLVALRSKSASTSPDDFFEDQRTALRGVAKRSEDYLTDTDAQIRKLALRDPQAARYAMRDVAESLRTHANTAKEEQERATLAEWMSGLARSDAGTREGGTLEDGRPALATNAKNALSWKNLGALEAGGVRGVLRLDVIITGDLDATPEFRITRAEVSGVAQRVAKQLLDADLRTFPIPILIRPPGLEGLRIMRDELGAITTVSGRYDDGEQARRHRSAAILVERILSKPLRASPIVLRTDDVDEHELEELPPLERKP